MPNYKLVYFNARGWAELSRLIFEYAGVPYEDSRFQREEWPKYKEESPLGQAPWLEVEGKKLPQSKTIARYLAREFNLNGSDDFESAECDALVDYLMDILDSLKQVHYEADQAKKEAECRRLAVEKVDNQLKMLEKYLAERNTEFAVGNNVTWADLFLFNFVHDLTPFAPLLFNMELIPTARRISEKIGNIPSIKSWVERRPTTAS